MTGLINDLGSADLALLATRSLTEEPPDTALHRLSLERGEGPALAQNDQAAAVYATLAVAQAIRELTEAINAQRG